MPPMRSVSLSVETIRSVDAVLIASDRSDVDYKMIASNAQLVIDARDVYRDPRG